MEEFIMDYQNELLGTLICLLVLLILRFVTTKAIRKVGKLSDINEVRTRLVVKYVSIGLTSLSVVALIFIWGVNVKELGLIFSSLFAVLGVALFASWSILSNITAGIILFFYFPFKIGDRIHILDNDFPEEAVIDDIRAFHVHLITDKGQLVTYPNSLLLQKGVVRIQ
ncbi:mechanosensitive ion channel domain-containing protein [Flavobacteriaceae bacterium 3-367]|uniref:mechanosensitive ion channel domain-containing protein n=1 Tax=Eudoraea algarum TaxID=3417568 RepID=UPI003293BF4C